MRILFNGDEPTEDEIVIDEIYVKLVGKKDEDKGQSVIEFIELKEP